MTAGRCPVPPVAIVGPTGAGKSALALALARNDDGEIVNADAMQQYRGMDIGTAKTPPADRGDTAHHQLDVLSVTETATVARYQCAARADVEAIMSRGHRPIIVGGSMMYIQALLDDWSIPNTDAVVRRRLESELAENGTVSMHRRLREVDPAAARAILDSDGRRIVRALEVVKLTGQPFAASAPKIGTPRWGTVLVGVDRRTDRLDAGLRARTEWMFGAGLIDEVRALIATGLREGVTARRAIGYAQVLDALDAEHGPGGPDVATAQRSTFVGTRRYVRRQRSWFRRDPRTVWFDGDAPDLVDRVRHHVERVRADDACADRDQDAP